MWLEPRYKTISLTKVASKAHNYKTKCVPTNHDGSNQTISQWNSSSQDFHLISENHANLDMEANQISSRDVENSRGICHKAPRQLETHSICYKVKYACLSSPTCSLDFCY
jgi:hypothetical protein